MKLIQIKTLLTLTGILSLVLMVLGVTVLGISLYQFTLSSQPKEPTNSQVDMPQNAREGPKLTGCFTGNTKILIKDFQEKNIEDVKVEDVILTRESESSSQLIEIEVKKLSKKISYDYLIINKKLEATRKHPMFANNKWITAENLKIGDYLLDKENHKIKITSIEKSKEKTEVYNLIVEKPHTFFANGFYVHNKGGPHHWYFTLKDSANNQIITDATVIMQTRSPYYSICSGGIYGPVDNEPWVFAIDPSFPNDFYIDCSLNQDQNHPSQTSISISKSGYISKTATISYDSIQTVSIIRDTQPPSAPSSLRATSVGRTSVTLAWNASTDNVGVAGYRIYRNGVSIYTISSISFTNIRLTPGEKYTYYVKAYDAVGNTSGSSNSISVNTTEIISDINLPAVFTTEGSKSTDLSKISDPKKVENLTLDVVDKNLIVFNDPVDLSSPEVPSLFKSLDQYIKMTKLGIVEVDSAALAMLAGKKAALSMFNLPFVKTPEILVNGEEDKNNIVSNIEYKENTLTFNITSFSKFEAVPELEISEPKNNFETSEEEITLKGTISDPEAKVSAKLNNKAVGDIKVDSKTGQFSKKITLKQGNNTIVVSATSEFGPKLTSTIKGEYKPQSYLLWIIIGAVILLLLITIGVWWYYKKRRAAKTSVSNSP